jgi:hypothetical protein
MEKFVYTLRKSYILRKSYRSIWFVYDEKDNWVSCTFTKIGAKLSARWDAYKRRNSQPVETEPGRIYYEV